MDASRACTAPGLVRTRRCGTRFILYCIWATVRWRCAMCLLLHAAACCAVAVLRCGCALAAAPLCRTRGLRTVMCPSRCWGAVSTCCECALDRRGGSEHPDRAALRPPIALGAPLLQRATLACARVRFRLPPFPSPCPPPIAYTRVRLPDHTRVRLPDHIPPRENNNDRRCRALLRPRQCAEAEAWHLPTHTRLIVVSPLAARRESVRPASG